MSQKHNVQLHKNKIHNKINVQSYGYNKFMISFKLKAKCPPHRDWMLVPEASVEMTKKMEESSYKVSVKH